MDLNLIIILRKNIFNKKKKFIPIIFETTQERLQRQRSAILEGERIRVGNSNSIPSSIADNDSERLIILERIRRRKKSKHSNKKKKKSLLHLKPIFQLWI